MSTRLVRACDTCGATDLTDGVSLTICFREIDQCYACAKESNVLGLVTYIRGIVRAEDREREGGRRV